MSPQDGTTDSWGGFSPGIRLVLRHDLGGLRAANVFGYGGGVREERFLESISKIVGDYDRLSTSTSTGRGQRTTSRHLVRNRILDIDELAALPKGPAIVLASGARPTLIRTRPWMTGPHAETVRA